MKFQDKYRIPSARLRNWDYGWNGHYFITICTAGHDPYFGVIENKKMVFSEIGILVRTEWEKSFGLRPGLYCDTYVIMPNHIHAILRIDNDDFVGFVETHSCASLCDNNDASTENDDASLDITNDFGDFDDFIRLTLTNSENLNYLISLDRATFIDSVIRDAGYDIFEKKLNEFKEYKKEISTNKIDINLNDAEEEVVALKDLLKTHKIDQIGRAHV